MKALKIHDFLERLAAGTTEAEFVAAIPHLVLVEMDAADAALAPEGAMTERIEPGLIQRQTQASRDALVLELRRRDGAEGPIRVGRAADCDLFLERQGISKEHARFVRRERELWLEDLASTNGTFVNVQRLEAGAAARVGPDDVVRFGQGSGFHVMDAAGFFNYLGLIQRFGL